MERPYTDKEVADHWADKIRPSMATPRGAKNDAKSYPIPRSLAAYLEDFESGKANPHGIKVRIRFRQTGIELSGPVHLTPSGRIRKRDRERLFG